MESREWRTRDKSEWGHGLWQDEPDKRQWVDQATGLPCLIVRNNSGALCGYVGVPKEHPWHGKDYGQCVKGGCEEEYCSHRPESLLDVHGGITFADRCTPITPESFQKMRGRLESSRAEAEKYPVGDSARYIAEWGAIEDMETFREKAQGRFVCHIPSPGESDDVWWFGFDCSHSGDHSPAYDKILGGGIRSFETYKDFRYVEREIAGLAEQLAAKA